MSYKPSILETMRRGPITLVSATYGTSGQLHQNVISGPKLTVLCLPEEGLYVLCRNRGLQIASACDRRKCYITQVCRCTEQQHPIHEHMTAVAANAGTQEQSVEHLAKKFMQDRALAWLNLYEAADEIRSLRLCFLAHPRTLSWDSVFDDLAFHFDSELEEHYASTHSYRCASRRVGKGVRECPRDLLDFVRNVWQEFLDRGDYDFRPVTTAFPGRRREDDDDDDDDEDSADGEDAAYDGDVDDMSEWDDADAPIHLNSRSSSHTPRSIAPSINHKKRPRRDDDFDFIDDLIDEEFPRLKKTMRRPPQQAREIAKHTSQGRPEKIHKANSTTMSDITSTSTKPNNNNNNNSNSISHRTSTAAANILHEGPPAPVIIPPKNMLIGRGLAGCSFGEQQQQGFGNRGNGCGRLGQPVRAVLRVASPC
ncbi:hypothetical protein F5B21DRAFT_500614 [Xylaria acuta]|nr:hypothetical protein F5B21DRAFT_500614 [Xylaria acuta]